MSRYAKGRRFEYRVRDLFIKNGFVVIRSAQSKPVDLVCMKDGQTVLVECKTEKSSLSKSKREELSDIARIAGVSLLLAFRKQRKIVFKNVQTAEIISIKEALRETVLQSP